MRSSKTGVLSAAIMHVFLLTPKSAYTSITSPSKHACHFGLHSCRGFIAALHALLGQHYCIYCMLFQCSFRIVQSARRGTDDNGDIRHPSQVESCVWHAKGCRGEEVDGVAVIFFLFFCRGVVLLSLRQYCKCDHIETLNTWYYYLSSTLTYTRLKSDSSSFCVRIYTRTYSSAATDCLCDVISREKSLLWARKASHESSHFSNVKASLNQVQWQNY